MFFLAGLGLLRLIWMPMLDGAYALTGDSEFWLFGPAGRAGSYRAPEAHAYGPLSYDDRSARDLMQRVKASVAYRERRQHECVPALRVG